MNIQNFIKKHLLQRSIISYLLYPLSLLYALILKIRRIYYQKKALSVQNIKLICVGNISSGGTGKTPFVIFLAEYLKQNGFNPAVITRGYHGAFENDNKLISDRMGIKEEASMAGDEPFLIARRLKNVPVVVGKNRIKSLDILMTHSEKPDVIIFDDAFQHVKIQYDYTFLVFNGESPVGNGFNLPAGILREPLSHARLSDFIVFNSYDEIPLVLTQLKKPILRVQYQITEILEAKTQTVPDLSGMKIALLSAIGVPAAFEKTVQNNGITFCRHFIFSDHYDFSDKAELEQIRQTLIQDKIDYILCTEKDFSKLVKIDHGLPLLVACSKFILNSADHPLLHDFVKGI